MNRRFVSTVSVIFLLIAATIVAILAAKGYRFDNQTRSLKGTGIVAVSSIPAGAAIYLNEELVSASNNTLSDLAPADYNLKVTKDGFSTWSKKVTVQAEKVVLVDVVLFPSTPDLRPLTFSGLKSPQLSPDGSKIVYAVAAKEKAGLWVLDITNRPFNFSRDPKEIAKDSLTFAYSSAFFSWTPDSKSILVTGKASSGKSVSYLLEADRSNDTPADITATLDQTKQTWQSDEELKNKSRLGELPEAERGVVSAAQGVKWSPDERKVAFIQAGVTKVYDLKKDKTADIGKIEQFSWYPDSNHLILVESNEINIVETDGTNKTPIYGGNFDQTAVFPWPDGSKLTILASFNQAAGQNLYSISLR